MGFSNSISDYSKTLHNLLAFVFAVFFLFYTSNFRLKLRTWKFNLRDQYLPEAFCTNIGLEKELSGSKLRKKKIDTTMTYFTPRQISIFSSSKRELLLT